MKFIAFIARIQSMDLSFDAVAVAIAVAVAYFAI